MRLVRIGNIGSERAGVMIDDEHVVDVSGDVGDFDEKFFEAGDMGRLADLVAAHVANGAVEHLAGRRLGAPIARPHQILCIGLNYRDHAEETGQAVPDEPIVFSKAPNTLVGPNDDILLPPGAHKTDWEVELGVVIGRRCSYLRSETEAAAAIAGYVLVNDVSERAWQLERGGQWVKGKSAPTFNPAGPYLVTPDEFADMDALELWLDVDGERRQTGTTRSMIFRPSYIVRYLSQFMTLEPGDLINTGTPRGVGMGQTPQIFLRGGERLSLGATGLGMHQSRVVEATA